MATINAKSCDAICFGQIFSEGANQLPLAHCAQALEFLVRKEPMNSENGDRGPNSSSHRSSLVRSSVQVGKATSR